MGSQRATRWSSLAAGLREWSGGRRTWNDPDHRRTGPSTMASRGCTRVVRGLPGPGDRSVGDDPPAIHPRCGRRIHRERPDDVARWHRGAVRHRRCSHRSPARSRHDVRPRRTSGHVRPLARTRGTGWRSRHPGPCELVADWTFATTAAIRLDCFIMVGNDASNRMVERAGFRREGVLRAWDLHHRGVPIDCVVFSRIRGDD